MTPKIAIIVPIYNSSDHLKKCLESIQNQTIRDIEIILINDGSTDKSESICKEFVQSDNRFNLINQKNRGVSVARNEGMKLSSAEFLCFVDSDDWVEKDFCEILLGNIIVDDYDLVMCGFKTYFSNDNVIADTNNKRSLITKNDIIKYIKDYKKNVSNVFGNSVWGKLFKRSIIIENHIQFIEGLRIGEDLLFVLEFQKHTNLAVFMTDEKLYVFNRSYNESATTSYVPNYWEDLVLVKKKSFEINKNIVNYTDEYKYYQYINVATKAILEEGKLNNGKKLIEKYKSIKELCNKKEVRHFCTHYKLQNEKNTFYHLLKKLITLNLPFVLVTLITCAYKFKII